MTCVPLYDADGAQIGTARLSDQEFDYIRKGGRLVRLYLRREMRVSSRPTDLPIEKVPVVHATAVPQYEDGAYVGSRLVVEFVADVEKVKTLKGEWRA